MHIDKVYRKNLRMIFKCLLFLFGITVATNAQVSNLLLAESTKEAFADDMTKFSCRNEDRLSSVLNLLMDHGAEKKNIRIQDFEYARNLELEKKGNSEETIVIGAHYDVRGSCGVIDNWSGITILANIYGELKNKDTEKTYKFIFFGREEEGLIGSQEFVESLNGATRKKICAMVNFDAFGLDKLKVFQKVTTKSMAAYAEKYALENNFALANDGSKKGSTDSYSFKRKKIPAIGFHGLSEDWRKILHSIADNSNNANIDEIYYAYRFGQGFVASLDQVDCDEFR